jgi:hypothetical protein
MLKDFLEGTGPDNKGRMLVDYHSFTNEEMENIHDYIQWMFPTNQPSLVNDDAPILNISDINETTRKAILKNLNRFNIFIFNSNIFERFNHNHLRITRVIHCLRLFELDKEALLFYNKCSILNKNVQSNIYWKDYLILEPWNKHND